MFHYLPDSDQIIIPDFYSSGKRYRCASGEKIDKPVNVENKQELYIDK
jgi:hypothetical protein